MKKHVRELLRRRDLDAVAGIAEQKRRLLGVLTSCTFDPDPQIGWRAVEAMGVACDRIARRAPATVRNHLRRLHWLISEESGGICWRAPEAMAEIVRYRPDRFAEYGAIVVSLLSDMAEEDLEHFRAGVLWAVGRLGAVAADHIPPVLPAITAALDSDDPQVRGLAAWCLGEVGRAELLAGRSDLLGDEGPVDLYEEGSLNRTSVGELVRRAVDR
jgi:hypothetical protein